jgi:hypothetical protein
MLRIAKGVAAATIAGAMALGGVRQADAQATTSTTTTSTTTTTLLPHPFSKATRDCIRQARAMYKSCRRRGSDDATCRTAFETAFPDCFASGSGVTCARRCVTRETTCLTAAPTTRKSCRKSCRVTRRADLKACRLIADDHAIWAGGDAACFTTAEANFDLCRFVCSEAELDCHTTFAFCVANCPNR